MQMAKLLINPDTLLRVCSLKVKHWTFNPVSAGSSPAKLNKKTFFLQKRLSLVGDWPQKLLGQPLAKR